MQISKSELTVFEAILARRSVRRYKSRKVDLKLIRTLLESAVRAPTAVHQEPWAFVIIQDKQVLTQISDYAKPLFLAEVELLKNNSETSTHMLDTFSNPNFNIFYNAGTLILICGNNAKPSFTADCWLAAENLILAACSIGLGSCIIGSALPAFNAPDIRTQLKIPNEFSVVAPIILGYTDEKTAPTLRKPPLILASVVAT